MTTPPTLGIRLDPLDKAMLKELATRLQRSQTQTIRDLVRETLAVIKEQDAKAESQKRDASTVTHRA